MKDRRIYSKNPDTTSVFVNDRQPVFCLLGPTAVGKTALALELARAFACEIISVDSMQVYRRLDIGTAKATAEERRLVPHHLIDIIDPDQEYSLARFLADAAAAYREIRGRGRGVLFTGGTGLYFRGLLEGIFELEIKPDPELRARLEQRLRAEGCAVLHGELAAVDPDSAARIHPHDRQRLLRALEIFHLSGQSWSEHLRTAAPTPLLPPATPIIGLTRPREVLYERINLRVDQMLAQGLEAEVRGLLAKGYGPELPPMQAIGYRHLTEYLAGERDLEATRQLLARDTRRYAKRQLTWFNRMPNVTWFAPEDMEGIMEFLGCRPGEG